MPAHNTLTLGPDRALYVGDLPPTGWHCHAAPVLLVGLSGRFALHLGLGVVESCHSALVDAGVEHLLDPCGEQVALMYLEPDSREARGLRRQFDQRGPVVLDVAIPVGARSAMDGYLRHFDLHALLWLPWAPAAPLDARVLRSYRVWSQVRLAMAGLAASPRLTDAALHGAFSDSAHFSRMFRQTFGMTPSSVLKPLKEVVLVP